MVRPPGAHRGAPLHVYRIIVLKTISRKIAATARVTYATTWSATFNVHHACTSIRLSRRAGWLRWRGSVPFWNATRCKHTPSRRIRGGSLTGHYSTYSMAGAWAHFAQDCIETVSIHEGLRAFDPGDCLCTDYSSTNVLSLPGVSASSLAFKRGFPPNVFYELFGRFIERPWCANIRLTGSLRCSEYSERERSCYSARW